MGPLNLDPSHDAGKFAYHLRSILEAGLIDVDRETRKYHLTDLGGLVTEFSWNIDEYALRKTGKLLVRTSRHAIEEFDRTKIIQALVREAGVPMDLAKKIAEEAEERLTKSEIRYLTAPLIREYVNAILIEKGLEEYRHKLTRLGLPVYDIPRRIKAAEEASLNVEMVHRIAGDSVIRDYVLLDALPRTVADAHLSGVLHICNIGSWILKPCEFFHDIRVFLEGGLKSKGLGLLASSVGRPKTFEAALSILLGALNTSCAEMAGEQAIDYFNVFLAPYLKDLSPENLRRALRLFIFNICQNPTLRLTLGLELSIPEYLKNVKAVGADGDAGIYGDYENQALTLFDALLDVMHEDDARKPIFNPHLLVKVRSESFEGSRSKELLFKTHQLASKNGTPYFANFCQDWQVDASYIATGARLSSDWTTDLELDTMRTGGLESVIINLPRIAYEAKGKDDRFFKTLEDSLEMSRTALEIKYRVINERMERGLLPFLSQSIAGESYFRLRNAPRLISFIGLNEATKAHTNYDIHEDKSAFAFATKIVNFMTSYARRQSRKPSIRLSVSQTPNDEAAQRLTSLDVEEYGWSIVKAQGTREAPYYTNLVAIPLEADVPLKTRLKVEEAFHPLITGGHLLPIRLKELGQDPEKLLSMTEQICRTTKIGCFTYTRSLTYCSNCQETLGGFQPKCPTCKSSASLILYDRSSAEYAPLKWWNEVKALNVSRRVSYAL
jgi:ribonucleoside-triphosphate reductase